MLTTKHVVRALIVAGALALAAPATSFGAYTFGSRLKDQQANAGECQGRPGGCTWVAYIHPSDPNGDPYNGGAPSDGVITAFRIRAFKPAGDAGTVTFRLANITVPTPNSPSATATAAGTGPTVNIVGNNTVEQFPARLPVKRGNQLALDGTNVQVTHNSSGDKFTYYFAPPLVQGQGPRGSTDDRGELLVQAVVEPDADKDGFGDQTQDRCPSDVRQQGVCDTTGPVFTFFALTRFAFTFQTVAVVRISEAGKVVFTFKRRARIRNRFFYVSIPGSFTRTFAAARTRRIVFTGRVNGRRLGIGYYRLVATASDALGNKRVATRGFRVLPLPVRRR